MTFCVFDEFVYILKRDSIAIYDTSDMLDSARTSEVTIQGTDMSVIYNIFFMSAPGLSQTL